MVANDFSIVGKRVPRTDAIAKVKGEAIFVPDIQLPGMLYAKTLRSPHAHARIVDIDTKSADALPGVKAILTFKNVPKVHPRGKLEFLLNETLRYCGDEVAMVAAETKQIAEQALNLINVKYELLPAVFDIEKAMQPGAPLVHPGHENNIFRGSSGREGWISVNVGDVEKGFSEADFIVEGVYETPMQATVSPMPRATVCQWTGNKLTCWVDTQATMFVWQDMAKCLGIPQSHIRLIVSSPVGSYGRKEPEKTSILTAILSKMTGRPVKTVFTREEDFVASWRRLNYKASGKVGVRKDGTITAIHNKVLVNCGADSQAPLLVLATSLTKAFLILYRAQNVKSEGCSVLTNTQHHGAVLGFGDTEGDFCIDRLMDEVAEKLGMDPVEFRIKNCLRYGDSCYERWQLLAGKNPRYGIVGPDVNMPEVITKVAERAGWREKWRGWQIPVEINKSKRRGIGVAMGVHHCEYKQYSAVVKMNHDGTASVLTGSVDMGQGCYTVIAQVVAEALGLNYSDVSVNPSDSDSSPAGFGNAGSSGVSSAVNAARHAAEDARRKLIEISAGALRVTPDELKIEKGKIFVTAHPEKAITIADACRRGFQVLGFGLLPSPDLLKDEKTGEVVNGLSIAAVIAEVEVDTDTGELNLIRLWSANDCGCALNPTLVENQVDLGIVMGNGWIRSEDFIIDQSNGVLLNPDLLEYKVMSHLDLPKKEEIDVTIVENPTSWGPYGAKGFSETAMVAVAPAITNAVYNAIGVRMRGPHLTPQKILEALGK